MAKKSTKRTSAKKSSVGKSNKFNLKNLNLRSNWKKLSYLGLAGFLAVSSIGYGVWKSVEDSASAASVVVQTYQNYDGPVTWNACKFYTIQGWKVKSWTINFSSFQFNNPPYMWSTVGNVYFPTAAPYSRSTITNISSGSTYNTLIYINGKIIPAC